MKLKKTLVIVGSEGQDGKILYKKLEIILQKLYV